MRGSRSFSSGTADPAFEPATNSPGWGVIRPLPLPVLVGVMMRRGEGEAAVAAASASSSCEMVVLSFPTAVDRSLLEWCSAEGEPAEPAEPEPALVAAAPGDPAAANDVGTSRPERVVWKPRGAAPDAARRIMLECGAGCSHGADADAAPVVVLASEAADRTACSPLLPAVAAAAPCIHRRPLVLRLVMLLSAALLLLLALVCTRLRHMSAVE